MSYSNKAPRVVRLLDVRHSDLVATAAAGGNWGAYVTPWIKTPTEMFLNTGQAKATLVATKYGVPTDQAVLNADADFDVFGRVTPESSTIASVTQFALAALDEVADGTDPASAVAAQSSNTVAPALVYPEMQVKVTGYDISTDAVNAITRATPSGGIAYYPPGITPDASERMQLYRPVVDPIPAHNPQNGEKFPVVIYLPPSGTPYVTSGSLATGAVTEGAGSVPFSAVSKGYACLEVRTLGTNTNVGSVTATACFWKGAPVLSEKETGAGAGTVDPRKAAMWAVQWVRAIGAHRYNLDPDRIFLVGFKDGGSHSLFTVYGGADTTAAPTSSNPQLRANPFPNLVGSVDPDIEWPIMDALGAGAALRVPLRNDDSATASTGTAAAAFGDGSNSDLLTLASGFSRSVLRLITSNANTQAYKNRIFQIPMYLSCGSTADDIGSSSILFQRSTTGVYEFLQTGIALGSVATQFSAKHAFLMRGLLKEMSRFYGADHPLFRQSVLNHAGTPPLNDATALLVDRTKTTLPTIFADMLDWASSQFRIPVRTPGVEPRYTIDLVY